MTTVKELRLENLRSLVAEFKTADAVAQRAQTAPMYLSQILNGAKSSTGNARGIGDKLARKLEEGCGKEVGWMDRPHRNVAAQFDENVVPAAVGLRPVPVISSVQAGALRDMESPYPPGAGYAYEYTDQDLSAWAFALDVEGLSMLPDFRPGDRIIVDPDMAPNPGDFVVARNGSAQATFKKYRPRGIDAAGNEIFELVPLNDDYPTLRSDTELLSVIGVVTEHRKKLRKQ
ncbi:LexA family protein [Massilia oculi]|nr:MULTISPECIES: S24 family peptidase [Massilia]